MGGRGGSMDFEFLGNWDGVLMYLKSLPKEAVDAAQKAQLIVTQEYIKRLKDNIINGYVYGPPKKYHSHDSRLLINTSHYLDNISYWKKRKVYYIGIMPGIKSKNGNIELRFLASIHEFGNINRKIPARPVWIPTYNQIGGIHGPRKKIYRAIKAALLKHKPQEVNLLQYGKLF